MDHMDHRGKKTERRVEVLYSVVWHICDKAHCKPKQCLGRQLWAVSLMRTILVRAECVRQRNEVAIKLGIIFPPPLSSRHLLNLQEGVVVGFQNFAWAFNYQKD
jgi:hypothetical protein